MASNIDNMDLDVLNFAILDFRSTEMIHFYMGQHLANQPPLIEATTNLDLSYLQIHGIKKSVNTSNIYNTIKEIVRKSYRTVIFYNNFVLISNLSLGITTLRAEIIDKLLKNITFNGLIVNGNDIIKTHPTTEMIDIYVASMMETLSVEQNHKKRMRATL